MLGILAPHQGAGGGEERNKEYPYRMKEKGKKNNPTTGVLKKRADMDTG
jgi:hypothetical protein